METRRRLVGFASCYVVGVVLAFVVVASYAVVALGGGLIDPRAVFGSAFGFAIACDAVRAFVARRPRIARARLWHERAR